MNIKRIQERSKNRYDNHRSNKNYEIGEFIYIRKLGLNQKLSSKYFGPYQVIQQLNNSVYRVQNPVDMNEILRVHANRIRSSH